MEKYMALTTDIVFNDDVIAKGLKIIAAQITQPQPNRIAMMNCFAIGLRHADKKSDEFDKDIYIGYIESIASHLDVDLYRNDDDDDKGKKATFNIPRTVLTGHALEEFRICLVMAFANSFNTIPSQSQLHDIWYDDKSEIYKAAVDQFKNYVEVGMFITLELYDRDTDLAIANAINYCRADSEPGFNIITSETMEQEKNLEMIIEDKKLIYRKKEEELRNLKREIDVLEARYKLEGNDN